MDRSLCRRFGPGRLPYANRRDVGGGIAMAANALLTALLWYAVVFGLAARDASGEFTSYTEFGFVMAGSLLVAPFAIPGAFVVGALCWRHLVPDDPDPRRGAVAGAVTVVGSLAVGAVGAGLVAATVTLYADGLAGASELAYWVPAITALAFAYGAFYVGSFAVPLFAFVGWYHERALRDRPESAG